LIVCWRFVGIVMQNRLMDLIEFLDPDCSRLPANRRDYCERCEMDRAYCEHGLAGGRQAVSRSAVRLLISPRGMAHFPGCPHKGDDPDFARWAEVDVPGAWERLGNGEHIRATGGNRPDLVADTRCRDCVEHGPW